MGQVMRMPEPQVQRQAEEELVQPKLVANAEYSIQHQIYEEDLVQTKPLVDQITPWYKGRLKRNNKSFRLSEMRIQPLKSLIILNHRSR